jgi:hypothetical protein
MLVQQTRFITAFMTPVKELKTNSDVNRIYALQ